jgi:two-component system, response regulator PdtaR
MSSNLNKILIVEDEAITAMSLQSNLEKLGYAVSSVAASGEDAIHLTDKLKPDLILMDIVLNGDIDGTEAAKQISAKHDIPIVFLTAYCDDQTIGRAKLSHPYGYLTKPYKQNDLRGMLEVIFSKKQNEILSKLKSLRSNNEFLRNMFHEIRTPINVLMVLLN